MRKEVWRLKRKEGVGRVLQREGGCGRREWEREGSERTTEGGMEGETKGGCEGGYYNGREGGRKGRREGWRDSRKEELREGITN